jgi:hypothetical protein
VEIRAMQYYGNRAKESSIPVGANRLQSSYFYCKRDVFDMFSADLSKQAELLYYNLFLQVGDTFSGKKTVDMRGTQTPVCVRKDHPILK